MQTIVIGIKKIIDVHRIDRMAGRNGDGARDDAAGRGSRVDATPVRQGLIETEK
jgi:hypothetical protein